MEEMTWCELEEASKSNKPLIFIVGSIEQHGPHLPLATDLYIPYELAKRISQKTGAIVAPPFTYGYKSKPSSGGGEGFPGTISLSGSTVIAMVNDIIKAFIKKGFKNIFCLNWHLENTSFVYEGLDLAVEEMSEYDPKIVVLDNPNGLVDQKILDHVFEGDFPGWEKEHAAIFETSLMLALKPSLVKEEKIIDDEAPKSNSYEILPVPQDVVPKSGVLWHATKASRAKGEAVCESLVNEISAIIKKEFAFE
jgi:creatinine amidohydrolase